MADAGLAGLEVHHRDHTAEAVRHLAALARSLGLLATGSSDYHGEGKLNRLGEHTTDARRCSRRSRRLATGSAVVEP